MRDLPKPLWETFFHLNVVRRTKIKHLRWLQTAAVIPCQFVEEAQDQDYVWRRIQVSQQQAERQKKNVIQLSLLFHNRAEKVLKD